MRVLRCSTSAPILKYKLHSHSTWEIVCQLEGEVRTEVGGVRHLLGAGDVLLIPPNTPHRGYADVPFRDLALRAEGLDLPRGTVLRDRHGDVTALTAMIERLLLERSATSEAVTDSLAEALVRMIRFELGASSGTPAVEEIKSVAYKNLSNADFSLAAHIAATGFDKDYFRRLFKKETGKTPARYLSDLRLTRAKQLLTDSSRFSIESIAHDCGFTDSFYFSSAFKKHVGVSPSEYRKRFSSPPSEER